VGDGVNVGATVADSGRAWLGSVACVRVKVAFGVEVVTGSSTGTGEEIELAVGGTTGCVEGNGRS